MGLFKFLFGNKTSKVTPPQTVFSKEEISSELDIFYDEKYYEMFRKQPKITDYYGRTFDFPSYDDSFNTLDGHNLREWLLLVWWGKPKNGRKKDVTIPKYFFLTYNLNAEQLTAIFKSEELLEDTDEKTILTDKGRVFYDKYKKLWEIHAFKNYPTNLDFDFPTWSLSQMEIKHYQMEINYLSDNLAHIKKMINRLESVRKPSWNSHIDKEINFLVNRGNSDSSRLNDLKQKLEILINKQNTIE